MWCSAADTHHKLLDRVVSGASFLTGGVFDNVQGHIVNLWQYYVCCTRSGVIRCTLFMVLYQCCMCRLGLHVVLWSHIGILMSLLAAASRSTEGLLFSCQCLCGTILVTQSSMVWDWLVSRASPMPSIGLAARSLFVFCRFPFLFFHSMGWYCGAGVFGLVLC